MLTILVCNKIFQKFCGYQSAELYYDMNKIFCVPYTLDEHKPTSTEFNTITLTVCKQQLPTKILYKLYKI